MLAHFAHKVLLNLKSEDVHLNDHDLSDLYSEVLTIGPGDRVSHKSDIVATCTCPKSVCPGKVLPEMKNL